MSQPNNVYPPTGYIHDETLVTEQPIPSWEQVTAPPVNNDQTESFPNMADPAPVEAPAQEQ